MMNSGNKQLLLSDKQLRLVIKRLAHQLLEDIPAGEPLVLIGIQPRGVFISDAIVSEMRSLPGREVLYGRLDITFYRDDFRKEIHTANETDITFSIEDKNVVLVDDVLYTGRTIRAALDALVDFGRPRNVKLCTLVNRRFNREVPIQPDYCGLAIDSNMSQKVKVIQDSFEVIMY